MDHMAAHEKLGHREVREDAADNLNLSNLLLAHKESRAQVCAGMDAPPWSQSYMLTVRKAAAVRCASGVGVPTMKPTSIVSPSWHPSLYRMVGGS